MVTIQATAGGPVVEPRRRPIDASGVEEPGQVFVGKVKQATGKRRSLLSD